MTSVSAVSSVAARLAAGMMAFTPALATAGQLHWPLPSESNARNGAPQPLHAHRLSTRPQAPVAETPVSPDAQAGLLRPYSGTPIDALNYHYDTYPTGWNRAETDLTPQTVASSRFAKLGVLHVDGNVFAQPLLASGIAMPDGKTHDVLIIATGHNTVYAYDARNYLKLWQVSLGTPQSTTDVGCADVQPEYGISSTPVIVRNGTSATIYVVAASEPAPFSFHTQLHALDLTTGQDTQPPREINPTAVLRNGGGTLHFDPQNQWNRTSLVYNKGSLYVGIGSHCDNNSANISGWLLRYNTADLSLGGSFNTILAPAGYELASIWMSGYAPAIDALGNVLAVTGNGNYSLSASAPGFGESVISLDAGVTKLNGAFTPTDWKQLNNTDADFGAGGVMALPLVKGQRSAPLAIAAGKGGTGYLMNTAKLGGSGPFGHSPLGTVSVPSCWCGPAYYATAAGGVVFYQGGFDLLRAYAVTPGATKDAAPTLTQIAASSDSADFGGSFPIVSTNGDTAGTGVVWLLRHGSSMSLEAYDAAHLGAPLYQGSTGSWSNGSRGYLTPLVANGRVYAPAYKTVTVFGLTD